MRWSPGVFDHPQLGKVEIGGWHSLYSWRNPPHALLDVEIAPQADFALLFASTLAPRLAWRTVTATPLGDDAAPGGRGREPRLLAHPCLGPGAAHEGRAAGPAGTDARRWRRARGRQAQAGRRPAAGKVEQAGGLLANAASPTDNRARAEWVVRGPAGATVALQATSERAGVLRRTIVLGADRARAVSRAHRRTSSISSSRISTRRRWQPPGSGRLRCSASRADRESSAWALAASRAATRQASSSWTTCSMGRMWYIRYFAVRADLRGQGWGSRILAALAAGQEDEKVPAAAATGGPFWRLRRLRPDCRPTWPLRLRRQGFYRRHGAIATGALTPRWPRCAGRHA